MSATSIERLAKLGNIVLHLFPKLLQIILKTRIGPSGLHAKYQLKDIRIALSESEMHLMENLPNMDEFTIELCYKILRYENLMIGPSCKWGNVPNDREVEIGDDVQRLLNETNEVISKMSEEISENNYEQFVKRLEAVIKRVDTYLHPGNFTCFKLYETIFRSDFDSTDILQKLTVMQKIIATCNLYNNGSNVQHIPLPYKPWFITKIDHTTVAVSCSNRHIPIIDIDTGTVTSTIVTSGHSEGISYNENNLYVVIDLSEVQMMDLTGKVTRTIPLPSYSTYYITVINGKLICIDSTSIYCCSLGGKQLWKFEERKYKDLRGLTTDGEGNVYVTDEITNTVLVVSNDGKNSIEILTESNGLNKPIGIHFDKKENILLVNYRFKGTVVLYDVQMKHTEHK
ncbi:Hypothetical predicted protein [Mytilus galloprovincialis]|uniref:DZIP3-like HEPN domain-containing protein n=1 Tax=Mytilus galloprovincialis TaxID=29158 RepID=A0A8B6CUY0_MYTGA|nr:Hypothetical predicted protein [Mytilus galloprovincialis]